ncbi:MAG TPA: hypothetical protein VJU15_09395 [Gemmatimonadales bacterium]|nr:hypothetical protein [Gemmatimonadales bacterium]
MILTRGVVLAGLLLAVADAASAQSWRVRIDARAQAVSYRGLSSDSISINDAVVGASGGFETPDGFAVQCSSPTWCYYYRPGELHEQLPMNVGANAVLWGFGVRGLTLHLTARLTGDAGDAGQWPGTEPAAQLIEGYAEYARSSWTLRGGRLVMASRLEPIGFDGAWGRFRWDRADIEVEGYAGWGLGQAAVVSVTSPLLTPLDDFRPGSRQIVAGAVAAWRPSFGDVRAEYRREVDPELDYFVSERATLSASARPAPWLLASGGVDYNIAEGNWGSADASLTWLRPRFSLTAGGRRYRPYFSLWTLWGAFSPVPWNGINASGELRALSWLSLRARGERYWYEGADVNTAIVGPLQEEGWRFGWGATARIGATLSLDGGYSAEFGPGAAARSFDAALTWTPSYQIELTGYGGTLERPLELRYYDAETRFLGARGDWRPRNDWRLWLDGGWYKDERNRPDDAASAWDQLRLRGGVTFTFGTDADRLPLPPARRAP